VGQFESATALSEGGKQIRGESYKRTDDRAHNKAGDHLTNDEADYQPND
jgi:hypothetical protein